MIEKTVFQPGCQRKEKKGILGSKLMSPRRFLG
jgi:hypothetical protein